MPISDGPSPSLRLSLCDVEGRLALRVEGLPTGAAFDVFPSAVAADPARRHPMAGHREDDGAGATFVPRFPFQPGSAYTVVALNAAAQVAIPYKDVDRPVAAVTAVYPTAAEIPVNHLRFYVHFSHPMSEGRAGAAIRMRDVATGETLEGALLPMVHELWDSEHRRLTVLLDPARIKRGLVPNLEAGYPLREGATVRLEIDAALPDSRGRPLCEGWSREYRVGSPVRARVDPSCWHIGTVAPGTRDPLDVQFGRVMDHALAMRCLRVENASGARIAGEGGLSACETAWRFVPAGPWPETPLLLIVDPLIEDVGGNSVLRVFDRDLDEPSHDPAEPGLRRIPIGDG